MVWSHAGVVAVQLPEAREIDTRRRIYQAHPEAREQRPPFNSELAIEGIAAVLHGDAVDLGETVLDMSDVPAFNRRVYELVRSIPRGETRTYEQIAKGVGVSGALHSVAQALARNPFMVIVPCHRVLEAAGAADKASQNGGVISKRRLLGIEGTRLSATKTLLDVLLPLDPPRPRP